jgi:hypothetical protein
MKTLLRSVAALGAFAAVSAHAMLTWSVGGGMTPFLALAPAGACGVCSLGGSFASISGGSIYTTSSPGAAAMPVGTVGNFLAAGPTPGQPSIITFSTAVPYVSFLWGSPDQSPAGQTPAFINKLTITTNDGPPVTLTPSSFGLPGDGNQSFAAYVQLQGTGGTLITSLEFDSTFNAFETANYSITPVPEPSTYALMLAGVSVLGWVARRRRG